MNPRTYPPLIGLIKGLPKPGQIWTAEEKNRFMEVFAEVLDYCIPLQKMEIHDPKPND